MLLLFLPTVILPPVVFKIVKCTPAVEVAGKVTNTAPTTASAVVRVVGYAMSDTPQLWINPDNTWVELS